MSSKPAPLRRLKGQRGQNCKNEPKYLLKVKGNEITGLVEGPTAVTSELPVQETCKILSGVRLAANLFAKRLRTDATVRH
jgi:hypothetical protein